MLPGAHGYEYYAELDIRPEDLTVIKRRYSAFVQGSSDLDAILRARGIDTVVVVGTLTNVCCESTARDAMMLNYRLVFVSDGNAALSDAEHNAALTTVLRVFGDVASTDEVTALLAPGATRRVAVA
jgi:ureidoacrylate peracid hydrolase